MMFYFAYGSNMSYRRLEARLPSVQLVTTATLFKHELRFHKPGRDNSAKCDAFETDIYSHYVHGVVYELNESEKTILDKIEGEGYEVKHVSLVSEVAGAMDAYMYYATEFDMALKPYHWYKEHVVRGAQEHGLPEHYIQTIHRQESIDDPDIEKHQLELSIYR